MASLKIVFLPSAIYITDSANAQNMQKELRKQNERDRRNTSKAAKQKR